jgi:NAD(P)H-flavin reductase
MRTAQLLELIFRNFPSYSKGLKSFQFNSLQILHFSDKIPQISDTRAVLLELTLVRPWKFCPGQYIYLCIPRDSITSYLQYHPFYISSWPDHNTIKLLVERRHGFTKDLNLLGNKSKVLILGPYRSTINLKQYGTVLLFATGIGIAAQLSYIKYLLAEYKRGRVMVKKIFLYWGIEEESK